MSPRWRDPRLVVTAVVISTLALPSVWEAVRHSGFAVGDIALIELRTRDVLSAHPPLVGAYSRYGWSHPGPLEFYLLAIPYRMLGGDFEALRLTTVLLNTLALTVIVWVARRRGLTAFVALVASACALVWGLPPNAMADSWNVTIDVLPFMLVTVACWCALCGDRGAWIVAAVGFSFVFQAHVGFGIVLAPLVVATAAVGWCERRAGRITTSTREVAVGAGAGLAIALPALYDVVAHWPGNLGHLISWSFDNDVETVGLGNALRLVGRSTSLSFPLDAKLPNQFVLSVGSIESGFLPGMLLVLLAAASWAAVRRRMRAEAALCGGLILAWFSAVLAAANVTQPLAFWLVEWLQPLAWLTWAAIAIVTWRLVRPAFVRTVRPASLLRVAAVALTAILAAGTVAYARGTPSADRNDTARAPIAMFTAAAADLDRSQPLHIDYTGDPLSAGTVFLAVADQLDRIGFSLCVEPQYANQFGQARVCAGRPDMRLVIRDEPTALAPPDGATALSISDPLPAAERAEADDLTFGLADLLQSNDLADDIPLLYTSLAGVILDRSPPPDVTAARVDILRLAELRRTPGTRLGLYVFSA